jgi:ATP-dependent DNA helicase RecG
MRVYYRDDKLVETTSGEAFIREGDRKRRLTDTEKREIRLNKGELDVESERITGIVYPDDFDVELLNIYRNEYVKKRQLEDRYSVEDVLLLSKLGRMGPRGFEPNLGCVLLFAKDPRIVVPGAYIRVLRYDGVEEQFGRSLNIIADRQIEGPLPYLIARAEEFIQSQIRNFTRLGSDGKFATTAEFPKDAWLEAIVNAVVHRSYNLKNMNIFVKMFEDKLGVESPGAFLPPTTATTVFDAHNPRNPNIMWALYYFDFVQCAFEGTRRMRALMRAANLPDPVFAERSTGTFQVMVTLRNHAEHRKLFVRAEAAAEINPEVYASLTESEKMLVNYLADQDRVNVTDAGLVIGMDWRGTKVILDGLEAKKVIARSAGKARSRHRFYYLRRRRSRPEDA